MQESDIYKYYLQNKSKRVISERLMSGETKKPLSQKTKKDYFTDRNVGTIEEANIVPPDDTMFDKTVRTFCGKESERRLFSNFVLFDDSKKL